MTVLCKCISPLRGAFFLLFFIYLLLFFGGGQSREKDWNEERERSQVVLKLALTPGKLRAGRLQLHFLVLVVLFSCPGCPKKSILIHH